ncbi:TetR/AcrR family transcriptional regulator [Pseudomonas sp. MYb185]|uniref:TetR/AcrR family transcriptional regulator n=1 Tax=Pseudomonas sp. MYb185 TaxID=1848729 RepID=UPI000CFC3685|nr:TetR/AcrR family transcriptional regulator [Pseudomonas sp. MYb185]PRB76502.1 TetR family transcriptional regulator [Pseudomonas sp. MYb185]
MKLRNTRDKILVTCRKLLNAKGVSMVTTASIAEAVGINEGNLYYYFKRKADIVNALFEQFTAEQLTLLEGEQDMRLWFQLMWDWRFFYRDSMALFTLEPLLRQRLREMSNLVQERALARLLELVEEGQLKASEEELKVLLENSWIISTYWIEYLHSRHGITRVTRKHLEWGYQQMLSLYRPYLSAHAPSFFKELNEG